MIRAFHYADGIVVVPMDFLRLPLIAVIGLLIYGEALDLWVFVGAVVILAGNFLNILKENRH
jgi:drug/metabolite transporter (DMT)-like permease